MSGATGFYVEYFSASLFTLRALDTLTGAHTIFEGSYLSFLFSYFFSYTLSFFYGSFLSVG